MTSKFFSRVENNPGIPGVRSHQIQSIDKSTIVWSGASQNSTAKNATSKDNKDLGVRIYARYQPIQLYLYKTKPV